MFEDSIKLNNKELFTYNHYGYMLLQSSQFDKLNNIIQIIKNIKFRYKAGLAYRLESEILIENGEYKSAENILSYYIYYIYYIFIFLFFYFFISFFFFKFYFYRN